MQRLADPAAAPINAISGAGADTHLGPVARLRPPPPLPRSPGRTRAEGACTADTAQMCLRVAEENHPQEAAAANFADSLDRSTFTERRVSVSHCAKAAFLGHGDIGGVIFSPILHSSDVKVEPLQFQLHQKRRPWKRP